MPKVDEDLHASRNYLASQKIELCHVGCDRLVQSQVIFHDHVPMADVHSTNVNKLRSVSLS